MTSKYLGYAHRLEYPTDSGVYYFRGDPVPDITQDEMNELIAIGHSFEEVDPDRVPDMSNLDPSARPAMTHEGVETEFLNNGQPDPSGPTMPASEPTSPAAPSAPPPDEPPLVT